jgi:hypothetical protein
LNDYYDPYAGFGDGRQWLKSQFHMHNTSVDEDGNYHETLDGMAEFFQEYKDSDYQIVAHATHNNWFDTSHLDAQIGIRSFNNEEYVDYDGLLLVGSKSAHRGEPQEVLDAALAEGAFVVICHPNQNPELTKAVPGVIPPLLSKEVARELVGAVGVEVYAGCHARRHWDGIGFGLGLATDFWDEELSRGRLLWGFGVDDSHQGYEVNVGWTEILAPSDDFETVKAAVKAGSLVASRGMRLLGWHFDGGTLSVEADLPYFRANRTEYRFIGEGGRVLHSEEGAVGQYQLRGDELYVRVEARNADGSILWTQPLLDRARFDMND